MLQWEILIEDITTQPQPQPTSDTIMLHIFMFPNWNCSLIKAFTKLLWGFLFKWLLILFGQFRVTLQPSVLVPHGSRNKQLIAVLLPKHLKGSRGLGAYVTAVTGPGDSTVTVTEAAARLGAVVALPWSLLIDAYPFRWICKDLRGRVCATVYTTWTWKIET